MRFAFTDPPYLGCCKLYNHDHGDGTYPWDGGCWDEFPGSRGMSTTLAAPPLALLSEEGA